MDRARTDDLEIQDATVSRAFLRVAAGALGLAREDLDNIHFQGDGVLPYVLPVDDFAAGTVAAAGAALRALMRSSGPHEDAAPANNSNGDSNSAAVAPENPRFLPALTVDRRLTGLWFGTSLRPVGWELPPTWDSIAGDYRSADGWIRLHTNAPHHRAAALSVLRCAEDRATVAATVARWQGQDLEQAVVAAGGCAAVMHTLEQWRAHPQGKAIAAEPLIAWTRHPLAAAPSPRPKDGDPRAALASGHPANGHPSTSPGSWRPRQDRPLAGLKVLDLTRILAGPVSTRFLAGYGADVLRIDPPGWDEPSLAPDVTLGKRCARLDLRDPGDRARFEALLAQADVLVHGYRPGALDGLGYGAAARRAINPALIDVTLDAYAWSGPWQGRRGYDSLVQMSSGIAHAGMAWRGADKPFPMPVQALDQGTGYLIAAAVLRGLALRLQEGVAVSARLSLARTAEALFGLAESTGEGSREQKGLATRDEDYAADHEITHWGPAQRARPPLAILGAPMRWDYPAGPLGTATAEWRGQAG
ncbi:acyl-CoA transferase [Achromobacter sp. HZ28]|nr:acyl-CoA transferase [Achromobacter sp. HZ34]OWT70664.1 acyl-CoA transferase [Achromobacter sp. HZ28]